MLFPIYSTATGHHRSATGQSICQWIIQIRHVHSTMNTLAAIAVFALAFTASAQTIPLQIVASPTPGVTNYIVYVGTNTLTPQNFRTASLTNFGVGTSLTFTVSEPNPPATWYFVVTAVKGGIESGPTSVLPVSVPLPPGGLMPLALAYTFSLDPGGSTWSNLFFKVKVGTP